MTNTLAQEQEAIKKAQSGDDFVRSSAIKELASLNTSNNVLKALADAVEDGDASYMLETALSALRILGSKIHFTAAKAAVENTALNHREWMIKAKAQDIIRKRDYAAMIAACE